MVVRSSAFPVIVAASLQPMVGSVRRGIIGLTAAAAILTSAVSAEVTSPREVPVPAVEGDRAGGWRTEVQAPPRYETWSGAAVAGDVRSLWGGLAFAPVGSLFEPGWRIRLAGGASQYHYRGPRFLRQPARCGDHGAGMQRIEGQGAHGEVLVGHQWQWGRTTVKAFAGATASEQTVGPDDPCNRTVGQAFGGKAALEAWHTFEGAAWLAFDTSAATSHGDHTARLRFGRAVLHGLDLGFDLAAGGNRMHRWHRAGLLTRSAWSGGELELSVGVLAAFDDAHWRHENAAPYVALNWLGRF